MIEPGIPIAETEAAVRGRKRESAVCETAATEEFKYFYIIISAVPRVHSLGTYTC